MTENASGTTGRGTDRAQPKRNKRVRVLVIHVDMLVFMLIFVFGMFAYMLLFICAIFVYRLLFIFDIFGYMLTVIFGYVFVDTFAYVLNVRSTATSGSQTSGSPALAATHRHLVGDLLQVDASHEVHLPAVDLQDVEARALIGVGELDLAVDPAGPKQRRIQNVDSVGRHQNLHTTGS